MTAFNYVREGDIVTVTIGMDGPVNTINAAFHEDLAATLDRLEGEPGLMGVLLTSAKSTFVAGGDLNWLSELRPGDEARLFAEVEEIKRGLRRIETLGVPVVAAINGSALGGGMELCLCCTHRIVADAPGLKLGFPEVGLGLLPGGGGVVRLTWLLGLEKAMPWLIEGRLGGPADALSAGLVDAVVPSEDLLARARDWLLAQDGTAQPQPWDRKGYRLPGGRAREMHNIGRIAFATANLFQKTRGVLPAPQAILDVMVESAGPQDFASAMRYETVRFAGLATRPETQNMIATNFFAMNAVKSGASRPAGVPKWQVTRLGVLGAGMMGQGIAYCAAMAGVETVLKDTSLAAAEKGRAYTAGLLDKRVARGWMSVEERDAVLARIHPTETAADLAGCDLVVEAVFERIDVKQAVLAEHEGLMADGGIWASNTSTLPISRLAASAARPANFIGLHFFSPVDRMPLLEIVVGQETSDDTLARAFDFARQIGKTPIVVGDGTGFFTSRTIMTTLEEAAQIVAEGEDPVRVETITRGMGYPTGLLTLIDEVKPALMLDVVDTQVSMGLRDPAEEPTPEGRALLRELVETHARRGRGQGGGFFDYEPEKRMWSGFRAWRRQGYELPEADIRDRILFRAILETRRCLAEGVLRTEADANVGSLLGIGAPVQTGGYAQVVRGMGDAVFDARRQTLETVYGSRFAAVDPSPALATG